MKMTPDSSSSITVLQRSLGARRSIRVLSSVFTVPVLALAVAVLPSKAYADTYGWTGATSTTWATASNWSLGGSTSAVVPGGGDVAQFNSATYTNQPNFTNAATIGELLFDSGNTGGTSFGSGSNILTINGINTSGTNIGMQINAGSGLVDTGFNMTLKLGASQTWLNNSALSTGFQSNGAINLNGFALTVDGSSNTNLNPSSGSVSGNGSIIKAGSGTLILNKANTYTGSISVLGGTLRIVNAAALGNSANTVTVSSGGTLDLRSQTVTNPYPLTISGFGANSGGALANNGSAAASYAGLVTLGADSSIVANTGSITLGNTGTITGSGFGLTVGGTSNTTIASIIGTGAGSLTKQDAGTLTISATNTYTGTTSINRGTLSLTGAINSSSALALGGGVLSYAPTTVGSTQAFANTTLNSGFSAVTNATATNTVSLGAITRNAGGVLNISSLAGTTTTTTGVDSTGILGTWATTGAGTTLAYAAGGSPDNGATAGTIAAYAGTTVAASAIGNDATKNYNVSSAGTLGGGANVNTLRYTGGNGTIGGDLTANGIMNAGSASTLTLSGSLTIGAKKELVIVANTQGTTISGNILDNPTGASSLVYAGAGTSNPLTLSGSNSYTGGTIVDSGMLRVANDNAVGNVTLNGGSILNVDSAGATINGNITGSGAVTKTNGGSALTLNGNNTFTGGMTLTDGKLILGSGSNNGIGTGTFTLTGGSVQSSDNNSRTIANSLSMGGNNLVLGGTQGALTGLGDLNFTSTVSTAVGGAKTWTVNNNTTVTFANDWSGNAGHNITKAGSGTLVFNGSINTTNSLNVTVNAGKLVLAGNLNNYTGTTTVSGGTLLVNGAKTSSAGTVAVTSGTLGGSGSIAGALTVSAGAAISPGSTGVGTLTVGPTTWNGETSSAFAQMKFELGNTANLGLAATSDKLALGTGVLTKGTGSVFQFDFQGTGAAGNTYTLMTFGSATFTAASDFTYTGLADGLTGTFALNAGSLQLLVIPEPQSWLMLASGAGLLMTFRRTRRFGK